MKAIVIFFEGDYSKSSEREVVRKLAETVFNDTTCKSIEKIQVNTLDDENVVTLLLKESATNKTKMQELEAYCQKVIKYVGSPALASKEEYRKMFLLELGKNVILRNTKIIRIIDSGKSNPEITAYLHKYGLDDIVNYIPDIRLIYKIYHYGEI